VNRHHRRPRWREPRPCVRWRFEAGGNV